MKKMMFIALAAVLFMPMQANATVARSCDFLRNLYNRSFGNCSLNCGVVPPTVPGGACTGMSDLIREASNKHCKWLSQVPFTVPPPHYEFEPLDSVCPAELPDILIGL